MPSSHTGSSNSCPQDDGVSGSARDESQLINEFIQALSDEINAIKRGKGNSRINLFDGLFVRQDGRFYVYIFTTENQLTVIDDTPGDIEVHGERFSAHVVSVKGSEITVAIEHDFGPSIPEAQLITSMWRLLELLQDRYQDISEGRRSADTRLSRKLFGLTPVTSQRIDHQLDVSVLRRKPNDEQIEAVRACCGSDVHFIWGPPGTGKTRTIGYIVAALLQRQLRILLVSHTNVATDRATESVVEVLKEIGIKDWQTGKVVRYGNITPDASLPETVRLDKIEERLAQPLKKRLDDLHRTLEAIPSQIERLDRAKELLIQRDEVVKKLHQLRATFQELSRQHKELVAQANVLVTELKDTKTRLDKARSAGLLKRLFLGLDPVKLQKEVNRLERNLGALHHQIDAVSQKTKEVRGCFAQLQTEERGYAQKLEAILSQFGLQLRDVTPARVEQLIGIVERRKLEIMSAIAELNEELEALRRKILQEARVIATSLTKATLDSEFDNQTFDVVVVDEASMAPLPSLYFAAMRATKKAVAVGDFRQLPPIALATTEAAKKWLLRDIFEQAGIQGAVDRRQSDERLTKLRRQYRMHPDISGVANDVFYGGMLKDELNQEASAEMSTFLHKSPFATTSLVICDVSNVDPWSCHIDTGGRYNLYSALVSAELAKRAITSGVTSIGVIAPYNAQARLIKKVLDDTGDPVLRHLKVSTVHRFQGLEEDVIIFDIAEGPMPNYRPSPLVNGAELGSQAAKLINVAITRAKKQLVIVAHLKYLSKRLHRDAVLLRVFKQARQKVTMVDSRKIVEDYVCEDFDRWARLLSPRFEAIHNEQTTSFTERNFYRAFFSDLRRSVREIIIVSPYVTLTRTTTFLDLFREKLAAGVKIRVFTTPRREQEMFRNSAMAVQALTDMGVIVTQRRGLHQKFAFIDRQVVWEGSLNILSHSGNTTEHMRRLCSPKVCEELIKLHGWDCDCEIDLKAHRVLTEHKCSKCDNAMRVCSGKHGIFLACSNYPRCKSTHSINDRRGIKTNLSCPGESGRPCGKPIVVMKSGSKVSFRCSDPNCQAKYHVIH